MNVSPLLYSWLMSPLYRKRESYEQYESRRMGFAKVQHCADCAQYTLCVPYFEDATPNEDEAYTFDLLCFACLSTQLHLRLLVRLHALGDLRDLAAS